MYNDLFAPLRLRMLNFLIIIIPISSLVTFENLKTLPTWTKANKDVKFHQRRR